MTPRQLHALEWVVEQAEQLIGLYTGDDSLEHEHILKVNAAKRALAAGWRDYRASRIDARTGAPRRALQRVKLDRPA